MQRNGTALFYSISGVAAARVRPVYSRLVAELPDRFPDAQIAFLGCPFYIDGRRKFPFPLLWNQEERDWEPTTRLLNCWKRLNEFGAKKVLRALANNDIVITERFGADALLYATADCDGEEAIADAEDLHFALVERRVKKQGIHPPLYFVPLADASNVQELVRVFPALRGRDPAELLAFMRHERDMLERYRRHGQNMIELSSSLSVEEMCRHITVHVGNQLEERRNAA